MSNIKNIILVFCVLMLASCGFTPVHKKLDGKEGIAKHMHKIYVEPVHTTESKYGVILRNDLNEIINPYGLKNYDYTLKVHLKKPVEIKKGYRQDGTASIASIRVSATFDLVDAKGKKIYSSYASDYSTYNIVDEPYAADTSYDYSVKRTLKSISDFINKKLIIYFNKTESEKRKIDQENLKKEKNKKK